MSAIILRYTNANSITTPSANRSAVFVDENGALAIKNDTGNITSFEVGPAGNTQVFFNANGNFEGSANFTFSSSTNVLTVLGNIAATRVLTDNLLYANGSAWDMQQPSGSNGEIQFNNNDSFGATGNLKLLNAQQLLVGATASNTNFPSTRLVVSQDDAGNSASDNIGLAAEAVANSANANVTGIGVLGHARANGATKGTGIQGQAFVTASGDTGAAVGVRAYAIDTHSGGYNIGFLGNAMNSGVGNYAFYVQNGGIASIENNTFWDLNDNSNAALTFNSTGKANIFGIETTDNSEGIFTSGYLNVTGNITAAGIKTNNYYYSNGSPVDFQQAAGSNTQIQYNNANDFGASANFTFNSATNVLTVTGNISTGNISATGAVNAATLGGSLTTASQPNVTSVGTLSSLTVTANITAGNVYANSGTIGASLLAGTLTTAAQPNVTSVGTLSSASVTGNVVAGNVYANSGTVGASLLAGTLTTAAQPNVTSVGTLTSLTVTGNVVAGNLNATSAVVASTLTSNVTTGTAPLTVTSTTRVANLNVNYANVSDFGVVTAQSTGIYYPTFINGNSTANYALAANAGFSANLANGAVIATSFVGNVSGNITGTLANGTSNVSIPAASGNVNITAAGNTTAVVTGTGANITGTLNATGNLTTGANLSVSGNALISGNLTVDGNITYVNVDTLAVEDPIIQLQTGPNGAAPSANSGKDVGTGLNYYDTQARIAWMGWDVSNVEFGMGSVVTIASEVVTFTSYGNLRVGNIIGNGQALTGLAGGNVTGQVGNAAIAGTVYTNAQPNITSVGSLTSLTLAANGNITMSGTASQLSGANLVSASYLTGTLTTAAQPNITSVGTLTSVAVTGNVTAGNVYANSGTVGASLLAGTLTTAAQPNVTSVGTLTSVAVTGNGTFGNVYANSGTVGASLLAGTLTTAAQPNITSVGTLTSLGVSGNITGPNHIANTGFFISSVTTGISAAGTVQANATALTTMFNVVSTVNSGTGVILPTAVAGMRITVMNTGGNTLNVYPATNGIINSASANVAFTLAAGGRLDFCAVSTTQWYTLSATYA